MYICIDCYQERGEKAMLPEGKAKVCQFCDEVATCYDIPIHQLQHWKDVAKYQGWRSED
jgi:hypothetical protein